MTYNGLSVSFYIDANNYVLETSLALTQFLDKQQHYYHPL